MILSERSMQDQCCTKNLWPQIERRSLLGLNVNLQSYRGDFRGQKETLQAQLVGAARSKAVIKPHVQREDPQPLRTYIGAHINEVKNSIGSRRRCSLMASFGAIGMNRQQHGTWISL